LQESIKTGNPDFRYLCVCNIDNLPSFPNVKELQDAYQNLIFQLSNIDSTLMKLMILYKAEYLKYISEKALKLKPKEEALNKAFSNYLNYVNDKLKNLEITKY
jgi:hypothetical protein